MDVKKSNTSNHQQHHAAAALDDDRFKLFLQNADEIESIEHFTYWKDEFFRTFRQYLDPLGTATAREADEELYFELENLVKICVHTKALVREGKITPEKSTVKGQKGLNEMIACTDSCEQHIDKYFPKTQEEETICGYSKFELAAVLVRDGFRVYGMMMATRDYIQGLVVEGGPLEQILRPNQMSILQYYFRCLETFAKTMADLGMFKLMVKCEELYRVRPRRKKNKNKKFNKHGPTDALSDTSGEDDVINGGRMFQKCKKQYRAIMDNGWSNGLSKGQEIKGPSYSATKKNTKKKKKKKKIGRKESSKDSSGKSKDNREEADDDENDWSSKVGSFSSMEDYSLGQTAETRDDLCSLTSSSDEAKEEEEEEDDEVIYYFDTVRRIVGKVSREKCLAENTVFSIDTVTGIEQAEGVVEEWDSKDGDTGKTDLILQLKDILRGQSEEKVGGLD